MNTTAVERGFTASESKTNYWFLSIIMAVVVYPLGSYINWKIICVCRRVKDKTWQQDVVHSISMMSALFVMVIFENISNYVTRLSDYTGGVWICYIPAFFYAYNTVVGGTHSFFISFIKYIYIVHNEKVRQFGEEKLKKIFFFTYVIHPLLLAIPTVILLDFEASTSLLRCFGVEDVVKDRYKDDKLGPMFLCKLTLDKNEDENSFLYLLTQGFCIFKMAWVLTLSSNIPEAFLYFKIFQYMKRYRIFKYQFVLLKVFL